MQHNFQLMTDVHLNHSICAQVAVQRSDVHKTNASTSENAHKTSAADDEIYCSAQLIRCRYALWLMCTWTTAYLPSPRTALRFSWHQCKHVVTPAAYADWDNQLMMNILRIPDHQALLHVMLQTFWLMCTGTQYCPQICITPMQAQVSTRKHHQLMLNYDADPSWPTTQALWLMWTGTYCSAHMCRKSMQALICWHLLRMAAADWDNRVIKQHQLIMNVMRLPDHQSLLHLII